MTVVGLVSSEEEARPVVTWAARFAAVQGSDLIIYYLASRVDVAHPTIGADGEEEFSDPIQAAIRAVLETVVRTRRARIGRIPRYAVSVRRITAADHVSTLDSRIQVESPDLFVGAAAVPNGKSHPPTIAQQVAQRVACDSIMLYGDATRSVKGASLLVGTTEGRHDKAAIVLAANFTAKTKGCTTAMSVEASVGDGAIEIGERELRVILRDLDLEESKRLKVKTVLGDNRVEAIGEAAEDHDLLLVGANSQSAVATLLESTSHPLIGLFRRAPQFAFGRRRTRPLTWLPRLNPTDYADLYEKLQAGSRWNTDFIVMLGLAAGIATLGLLQNSPAVVIGSMLLAPLMTPMIGMGLALNQGNAKLAYTCFRAIGRGFLAALVISAFVGWITPGSDPTVEVLARTEPNILDLLIAIFSGMAAAYALARPSLAGTIAGVAIATALVPPLCAAGISLSQARIFDALGAVSLLLANVLAIILAAAATFRAMGLVGANEVDVRRPWVRRVVLGLTVAAMMIAIPLSSAFMDQVHRGKNSPIALTVTNETRDAIVARIHQDPGVTLLMIGRPGIPRESDIVDVGIVISSDRPLPRSYGDALAAIVRTTMQDPELRVRVACVAGGWAQPQIDAARSIQDERDPES